MKMKEMPSTQSKRDALLRKMKAGHLSNLEKEDLIQILTAEKSLKEKRKDVWGTIVVLGLLHFLTKK